MESSGVRGSEKIRSSQSRLRGPDLPVDPEPRTNPEPATRRGEAAPGWSAPPGAGPGGAFKIPSSSRARSNYKWLWGPSEGSRESGSTPASRCKGARWAFPFRRAPGTAGRHVVQGPGSQRFSNPYKTWKLGLENLTERRNERADIQQNLMIETLDDSLSMTHQATSNINVCWKLGLAGKPRESNDRLAMVHDAQ